MLTLMFRSRLSDTGAMNFKSLVYDRSSPFESFSDTRQQLTTSSVKSLVYSRIEPTASSQLEGTSFESQFRSVSSKFKTVFSRC